MTPKELASLADKWWKARAKRLAADRKAAELKSTETLLKDELTQALLREGVTSVGGRAIKVELVPKKKYAVGNWEELYNHILQTGSFDLLQRRLTETAARDRWEDGEQVPGVYEMEVNELSYSQVKKG